VLWIASAQFLAHLLIRAVPEAAKILSDLDGAAGWGEEGEGDRYSPRSEARRLGEAEQLLQFGGGDD